MWVLSLISFLLLGGYLLITAMRYGMPNMISDTFYQLRGGDNDSFKGYIFTFVMFAVGVMMLMCMLETEQGYQWLAFLGGAGLMFVGAAPDFTDSDVHPVHKLSATIAATGCILWCLTTCWWVTVVIAILYALYIAYISSVRYCNEMWHISSTTPTYHPLYWGEVAAFMDVFVTYWVIL